MVEVAKKLGDTRALYLVTTHFHPEHDLGAQAFPENTTLVRSNGQVKDIAELGLQLAQVSPGARRSRPGLLENADFRKANVTFDRILDLRRCEGATASPSVAKSHAGRHRDVGEIGPRSLLRRCCHAPAAGFCQSVFDDPAVALEPRQVRSAQAGSDCSRAMVRRATRLSFPVTKYLVEVRDRTAAGEVAASKIRRLKRSPPRWRNAPRQGTPCRCDQGGLRRSAIDPS